MSLIYLYCLNIDVMCIVLNKCHMPIHIVYMCMFYVNLCCLNNAQFSYLNNTNLGNNIFHTNMEWTHEAYKFVM